MPSADDHPARRSASEIRIAFKSMTVQRLPRVLALEKFDLLWDEANGAAMSLSGTAAIADYISLLKEMQAWYSSDLRGPV